MSRFTRVLTTVLVLTVVGMGSISPAKAENEPPLVPAMELINNPSAYVGQTIRLSGYLTRDPLKLSSRWCRSDIGTLYQCTYEWYFIRVSADETYDDPNKVIVRTFGVDKFYRDNYYNLPIDFYGTWTQDVDGTYYLEEIVLEPPGQ
jgi:hypothetical protein